MKRVDPSVYTKDYYLKDCSGFDEFKNSWGKNLEPRLEEIIKAIPSVKNAKVLDIGCGRGEMIFWAILSGAKKACGIDYSKDAIKLAKSALARQEKEIQRKSSFRLMDAKNLKYKDKSFDAVFMIEVLEHLYEYEQIQVFNEVNRVLKPDGFLFIHTAPSRWFNDYTYKYWCYPLSTVFVKLNNIITGNNYSNLKKPSKIRTQSHLTMHVAEPSFFQIQKLIDKTGFEGSIKSTNVTVNKPEISWKDQLFNFLIYLYPLSKHFPFNILWGNDYYAVLRKK